MNLVEYLTSLSSIAVALSGGVDSSYLAYAAKQSGIPCKAYTVKSQFVPQFELNDAKKIAEFIDIPLEIIDIDVLAHDDVTSNPDNRCYYCKHYVFTTISEYAKRDGFTVVCDGTNASDDIDDRPGMRAIAELSVKSPLRDCGLTKSVIRKLAQQANLFTWNKPSYSCLATRFQAGQRITGHDLEHIELAEKYLFSLDLSDFRVRLIGNNAKIQVPENQIAIVIKNRIEILTYLKSMFDDVVLDLEVRS
ncbi:ATP-dependent sacrificial sulfur transferase LarE [uncultured Veillonella sp.]|uniref:ATP-dependent sacrificial sulfur transferase LarE n=1 Tax=uncultured Veillonella sp. TaxID=159268 RepID=UPI00266F7F69|nr:ATP-dependent sacrificial sulfur transferase LarE [uncultured Veillonella sp.]